MARGPLVGVMSKLDERSESTTLERTNSVGHRLGWVLAMPENALGYTRVFLGKSVQDDENKGDVFRSFARERKSERVCVAIEPSGSFRGKFSWSPSEEGTIYRAPTGGEESEREYATPGEFV